MKVFCIRYPRNKVTDVLICLMCIFIISLILSNGKTAVCSVGDEAAAVVDFIESYGWSIEYESLQISSKLIPYEFDDVYDDYKELQNQQGFTLDNLKGKTVQQYSYRVLNFPGYENSEIVFVNILLYDGKISAADICCTSINGFITGVVR